MNNYVSFINPHLKDEFYRLRFGRFDEKQICDFLNRTFEDLRNNPCCGTKLPRKLWPDHYVKRYEVTNLWKYDLPNGWRLIYTMEHDGASTVCIILEWFSHKEYERRFKY